MADYQRIDLERLRTPGSDIDDTLNPPDHDASADHYKDTLNFFASQISKIIGKSAWDAIVNASESISSLYTAVLLRVIGPSSATDHAVARYDGTGGKLVQDSDVIIDDDGNITTPGTINGRDVIVDGTNLDNHLLDLNNPHDVVLSQVGPFTLAELNAEISDANVDDLNDPRDPNAHNSTHYKTGSDPIIAQYLSSNSAILGKILETDGAGGFHLIDTPEPSDPSIYDPEDVDKSTAQIGTSDRYAREDHKHDIDVGDPVDVDIVNHEGTASSLSRSNHKHKLNLYGSEPEVNEASTGQSGTSNYPSRGDHRHDISTGTPVDVGTSNQNGTAVSLSRSDHVHSHGYQGGGNLHSIATISVAGFLSAADKAILDGLYVTPLSDTAPEDVDAAVASAGVASEASRQDHKHDILTGIPVAVGSANTEGTADSLARSDHIHYGFQTLALADCLTTDTVGDCVYIRANEGGGRYRVEKADPTDFNKMPAVAIIVEKTASTECSVQFVGPITDIYTGLTKGQMYCVDTNGRLTDVPPSSVSGTFVQHFGVALSSNIFHIFPSFMMVSNRS
jgi:hypothetical protein